MKLKTTLFATAAVAVICLMATALTAQSRRSTLFERLTQEEGMPLTLYTDISAFIANKNSGEYLPGTLTEAGGHSWKVSVKPRGKYRRKICAIPPLKVKVKKKLLEAEGLDTLNELKLVLPCTLDEKGETLLLREYLTYRMFEQISPYSARARLINLTLLNAGLGNEARYTVKAFLLEDEEETVARIGGELVEYFGMTPDSLATDQAALTAVFQYMIGNTDWNITEQRNVRFIRQASGKIILVPFDFDFCGFVNAPYATPTAGTGLTSVRERYLMADGIPEAALTQALHILQTAQSDMYRICQSGAVAPAEAAKLVDYLDSFFRKAEKNNWKNLR